MSTSLLASYRHNRCYHFHNHYFHYHRQHCPLCIKPIISSIFHIILTHLPAPLKKPHSKYTMRNTSTVVATFWFCAWVLKSTIMLNCAMTRQFAKRSWFHSHTISTEQVIMIPIFIRPACRPALRPGIRAHCLNCPVSPTFLGCNTRTNPFFRSHQPTAMCRPFRLRAMQPSPVLIGSMLLRRSCRCGWSML